MVGGEWVVTDRRLVNVDQRQLAADALGAAERLWERLAELEPHAFEPKGGS